MTKGFVRVLSLTAAVLMVSSLWAEVKVQPWTPVYVGVEQTMGLIDGKDASAFYAMRVDLQEKGISVVTTPQEGKLDTVSETTSDFLKKFKVQVAINAGFFAPCCAAHSEEKHILGLSITEGRKVSAGMRANEYRYALLLTRDKQASIVTLEPSTSLSNVWTALTGSAIIVTDGKNTGDMNALNEASKANPRTVVGLSKDKRYLYMVVVDGRRPGYSIGTTNMESAEILLALGADTAMNLDGGGSTAMVKDDGKGNPEVVNHPSGGVERFDANQLGIKAELLPQPVKKK